MATIDVSAAAMIAATTIATAAGVNRGFDRGQSEHYLLCGAWRNDRGTDRIQERIGKPKGCRNEHHQKSAKHDFLLRRSASCRTLRLSQFSAFRIPRRGRGAQPPESAHRSEAAVTAVMQVSVAKAQGIGLRRVGHLAQKKVAEAWG